MNMQSFRDIFFLFLKEGCQLVGWWCPHGSLHNFSQQVPSCGRSQFVPPGAHKFLFRLLSSDLKLAGGEHTKCDISVLVFPQLHVILVSPLYSGIPRFHLSLIRRIRGIHFFCQDRTKYYNLFPACLLSSWSTYYFLCRFFKGTVAWDFWPRFFSQIYILCMSKYILTIFDNTKSFFYERVCLNVWVCRNSTDPRADEILVSFWPRLGDCGGYWDLWSY
jgi:hypothetical protein